MLWACVAVVMDGGGERVAQSCCGHALLNPAFWVAVVMSVYPMLIAVMVLWEAPVSGHQWQQLCTSGGGQGVFANAQNPSFVDDVICGWPCLGSVRWTWTADAFEPVDACLVILLTGHWELRW